MNTDDTCHREHGHVNDPNDVREQLIKTIRPAAIRYAGFLDGHPDTDTEFIIDGALNLGDIADAILEDPGLVAALSRAAMPESGREDLSTEVTAKREMASPVYVLRGGVYLLDEHAGVLIDSAGNFSAKTRGNPRSLAVLLRAIAEAIEDDVEPLPEGGEG